MLTAHEEALHELWKSLATDGANEASLEVARAVIEGYRKAGFITDIAAKVWSSAIEKCPGHNCSAIWCAYCGDLPMDEDDPRRDP
jgi:hypothetical protein